MTDTIPVKWRLEAAILRLLLWGFGLLGVERASATGGAIARFIGPKLGVNKRAARNLKLIFPDITDEAIALITREMWENLGRTAAEYAHLDKFDPYREGGRIIVRNIDRLEDLTAQGRGVIFVGGHLGNWELQPLAATHKGIPVMAVYRAANNVLGDAPIADLRARYVTPHLAPKGATGARQLVRWLKQGKSVAMLVDQKMNDGVTAPFMGRMAMCAPAPAQLARRFGYPILPAMIRRTGGAQFEIVLGDPVHVAQSDDREADMLAAITEYNAQLERFIRRYPGQWLWLHRRWPES